MIVVHATCVSLSGAGVLLRGPSGAGKSDLALRLVGEPGSPDRLVADDRVALGVELGPDQARDGMPVLWARAPAALAGLLEVRGVGILPVPAVALAPLALVVDLVPDPTMVPRLPEEGLLDAGPAGSGGVGDRVRLAGVELPRLALWSFAASTPAALRLAAAALAAGHPLLPPAWQCVRPIAVTGSATDRHPGGSRS